MGIDISIFCNMKVIAFLFLAASASAEWTCEDCAKASKDMATYSTSEDAINVQSAMLVASLCDQAPDPEQCAKDLPVFWAPLAKIIFPEHYKHVCDDMPCTDILPPEATIPNCQECSIRINAVTDYLGHDDVIQGWIQALQDSEYCEQMFPEVVGECEEGIDAVLSNGLPILIGADREWVDTFCTEFGCTI